MKYGQIMQVLDGCSPHNAAVTMHVTMLVANCISSTVDLALLGAVHRYILTPSSQNEHVELVAISA